LPAWLARRGYVVWVAELRGRAAGGGENGHGFAHYVDEDAPAVIAAAKREHHRVAYVGHSMGGLVGYSLDQDAAQALTALVTLGSPLVPGDLPPLSRFNRALSSSSRRLAGASVLAKAGLPFRGSHFGRALWRLQPYLDDPRARGPLRLWAAGSLTKDELRAALVDSFCDDGLGVFADLLELRTSGGERAGAVPVGERLRRLQVPLLVVAGGKDGIAPAAGVRLGFERAGSLHKEYREISVAHAGVDAGHIDLLVGRHAPDVVWPLLGSFLDRHLR
jgi:polyhydroxyalkanoate synthase